MEGRAVGLGYFYGSPIFGGHGEVFRVESEGGQVDGDGGGRLLPAGCGHDEQHIIRADIVRSFYIGMRAGHSIMRLPIADEFGRVDVENFPGTIGWQGEGIESSAVMGGHSNVVQ